MRSIDLPSDFMAERPMNVPPDEHGVFDDDVPNAPKLRPISI